MMTDLDLSIIRLEAFDVRFPTSLSLDGSDAVHVDPDYSLAYVILHTEQSGLEGHGFTFTIGRGTEVVVKAIEALKFLVVGKKLNEIFGNFGQTWKALTNDSQLRWLGPEKGVIHLATAAIVNALWDLWAKLEQKPLWKLLCDMEPEQLIKLVDFRYLYDSSPKEKALDLLRVNASSRNEREKQVLASGIPAYVTSAGWLGYSDDKIKTLCKAALADGWTRFKMKVGANLQDDKRRAAIIREQIGNENILMMDANQNWDVAEAIDWMKQLAQYKPLWIEEPTSCDDVLGHAKISKALAAFNIGVATGEHCQNRVLFKQFLDAGAMQFCQIDSCRLGGVNEIISVLLLAASKHVPVCPHAGGVGLCELVQHLAIFNYICVAPTLDNVMVEFADHLHEHFVDTVKWRNGAYLAPNMPGYSSELKKESLDSYVYPNGSEWQKLFCSGKVKRTD